VLEIEERIALAMCKMGEGFYLLDKEGVFFKRLNNGDDVDVPVLTGYYGERWAGQGPLNKTWLLKKLALSKSFPTINMVRRLNGNTRIGLSLYTDNGFLSQTRFRQL